jgi:hypothetical protein
MDKLPTWSRVSRCLSVIRDLVTHLTCFIPVNICWHKYSLPTSKVMKNVCLWVPGYSSCETQLMLNYKKSYCWTYPSSQTHTENQHTPSADPLGHSSAIMENGDEKRLKLKLLRLKSWNPVSNSCLISYIILTYMWESRNYTSREFEIARNYAFQLWFLKMWFYFKGRDVIKHSIN